MPFNHIDDDVPFGHIDDVPFGHDDMPFDQYIDDVPFDHIDTPIDHTDGVLLIIFMMCHLIT